MPGLKRLLLEILTLSNFVTPQEVFRRCSLVNVSFTSLAYGKPWSSCSVPASVPARYASSASFGWVRLALLMVAFSNAAPRGWILFSLLETGEKPPTPFRSPSGASLPQPMTPLVEPILLIESAGNFDVEGIFKLSVSPAAEQSCSWKGRPVPAAADDVSAEPVAGRPRSARSACGVMPEELLKNPFIFLPAHTYAQRRCQ